MKMNVTLLGHTKLSDEINLGDFLHTEWLHDHVTDGAIVAFGAIRTCYSHKNVEEIFETEGKKYFGEKATDGGNGSDADRLIRHIMKSKHVSTMEHLNFTFAIEGVSRALLAQLTRHRHMSFSVQSQRYTKFSSDSRSNGFDYVVPEKIINAKHTGNGDEIQRAFRYAMESAQEWYDSLIDLGISQEDARSVLPNAATCNLVLTANLRTLLEFYSKRSDKAAQSEIRQLAEELKNRVIEIEPWTKEFFE